MTQEQNNTADTAENADTADTADSTDNADNKAASTIDPITQLPLSQGMQTLLQNIKEISASVSPSQTISAGKLVRGVGLTLEAIGCKIPIGGRALVQTQQGRVEAEVVGFADEITLLNAK